MSVRILLADDHQVFRQGLRNLLEQESGLTVAAEANNGRDAVRLAHELRPDVVLLDVSMPDLGGIEAARRILAAVPEIRVIGLSMHSNRAFVQEMLRAGASGYVLKECAFEEVVTAIRQVLRGHLHLCPKLSTDILRAFVRSETPAPSSAFVRLTGREREVLQLLAEGSSTKEIAVALKVSPKTVETFRQQIMRKLELRSVAELTKYAVREGLTSLGD